MAGIDLTELHAKATRLNRAAVKATAPAQMQIMSANSRAFMVDILFVSDAVKTLFPEDEIQPITNEWLKEIGGEVSDDGKFMWFNGLAIRIRVEDDDLSDNDDQAITPGAARDTLLAGPQICGNYILPSVRIRMDVRILLSRLNLSQKPEPEEKT